MKVTTAFVDQPLPLAKTDINYIKKVILNLKGNHSHIMVKKLWSFGSFGDFVYWQSCIVKGVRQQPTAAGLFITKYSTGL